MTPRLTTEELAGQIRELGRKGDPVFELSRPIAHDLIAELGLCLPYLDPADVGAVLMHASSCVAGLIDKFREEGVSDDVIAVIAVNIMAIAGSQMDRKARTSARPR